MLADGTRDDMERGPEWAKANLPPDRLENILRLIEVEEQLEFRCGVEPQPDRSQVAGIPSGGATLRGQGPGPGGSPEEAFEQEQRAEIYAGADGVGQAGPEPPKAGASECRYGSGPQSACGCKDGGRPDAGSGLGSARAAEDIGAAAAPHGREDGHCFGHEPGCRTDHGTRHQVSAPRE